MGTLSQKASNMLCYQDMTFCICSRKVTDEVKGQAQLAGLPIATANICGNLTTCAQCGSKLSEQEIAKILKMECGNNHEHYCSECFNKESIK